MSALRRDCPRLEDGIWWECILTHDLALDVTTARTERRVMMRTQTNGFSTEDFSDTTRVSEPSWTIALEAGRMVHVCSEGDMYVLVPNYLLDGKMTQLSIMWNGEVRIRHYRR